MKNSLIVILLILAIIGIISTVSLLSSIIVTPNNNNTLFINQPLTHIDIAEEINLAKSGDTLIVSYDDTTLYIGFYHPNIHISPKDKLIILQ